MIHSFCCDLNDSWMYICVKGEKALVIDPCVSDEALRLMRKNNVVEALVLLTHEHYDHISGVNWLRESIETVKVLCSEKCASALPNPTKNLSAFSDMLFVNKPDKGICRSYSCNADETFEKELCFSWEGHELILRETPGHSKGSICIIMDESILFSGDSLLLRAETITRLPGGSKKQYTEETLPFLKSLSRDIMVYPGHGEGQVLGSFFS